MRRGAAGSAAVAALGVVLAAGLLPGCSRDDPGPGEGRLVVQGEAIVRSADGEERVTDRRDLRPDDEVEMVEGTAVVELADHVTLELREGRESRRA